MIFISVVTNQIQKIQLAACLKISQWQDLAARLLNAKWFIRFKGIYIEAMTFRRLQHDAG